MDYSRLKTMAEDRTEWRGGAENAGVENAGVDSRGGKCRRDNVWKAVRTENS